MLLFSSMLPAVIITDVDCGSYSFAEQEGPKLQLIEVFDALLSYELFPELQCTC